MKNTAVFILLRAALALLLAVHCYYYGAYILSILRYEYLIDYGESFVLNQACLLRNGWSIFDLYSSIETPPFLLINYPPVYPWLVSFFQGDQVSFIPGRIVSVFASVGIVLLIMGFLMQFRLRDRWVLLFPPVLFATYAFYLWSGLYRVDMLALFFLMGSLFFLRWEKVPPLAGALFLILAVYTRQTLLPLPGAIFLVSIFTGNRRWQKLFLYWLAGSFAVFLMFQFFTGGEFMWHTVIGNRNILMMSNLRTWANHLLRFSVFFILAWLFSLYSLWKQKDIDGGWKALLILFSIFSALFVLTISKVGSAVNYLLEWYIAMIIVIALATGLEKSAWRKGVIYLLILCFLGNLSYMRRYSWASSPRASDIMTYRQMERMLQAYPYPVISYDGGIVLRAGKEIVFQPFVLTQLGYQHIWSPDLLLNYLQQYPQYMMIVNFSPEREGGIRTDIFHRRLVEKLIEQGEKTAQYQFSYQSNLFCYIIYNETENERD